MRRKAVARRLKTITRLRSFLLASRDFLYRGLTRRPARQLSGMGIEV